MAKPTLIEIVQDILSDADGDEVNDVDDTIESTQCARVIQDTFRNIVDRYDLKVHNQLDQLTATDSNTPTVMDRPEGLFDIKEIQYDKREEAGDDPAYQRVQYMDPLDFLTMTGSRTSSDSTITAMALTGGSNHSILIRNDQAPTFYTQLEGYDSFVFDAYDVALEANLQTSKTLVYGTVKPTLSLTSAAVIDLPEHLYTLLRNDARAFFFDLYKDGATREVDKRQRRSEVRSQRERYLTRNQQERQSGPDYGRKAKRRTGGGVNDRRC